MWRTNLVQHHTTSIYCSDRNQETKNEKNIICACTWRTYPAAFFLNKKQWFHRRRHGQTNTSQAPTGFLHGHRNLMLVLPVQYIQAYLCWKQGDRFQVKMGGLQSSAVGFFPCFQGTWGRNFRLLTPIKKTEKPTRIFHDKCPLGTFRCAKKSTCLSGRHVA